MLAVVPAIIAGWTDWHWRRIPNWLTVPTLVVGLALSIWADGWLGARNSLLGAALGFVLLLPLALVRGLGMGDLKLTTALGAFLGPARLLDVLLVTVLLNGLIAIVMIIWKRRVLETLRNLGRMLGALLSFHLPGPELTLDNPNLVKIPFGVAFAIAVVLFTARALWGVAG